MARTVCWYSPEIIQIPLCRLIKNIESKGTTIIHMPLMVMIYVFDIQFN